MWEIKLRINLHVLVVHLHLVVLHLDVFDKLVSHGNFSFDPVVPHSHPIYREQRGTSYSTRYLSKKRCIIISSMHASQLHCLPNSHNPKFRCYPSVFIIFLPILLRTVRAMAMQSQFLVSRPRVCVKFQSAWTVLIVRTPPYSTTRSEV